MNAHFSYGKDGTLFGKPFPEFCAEKTGALYLRQQCMGLYRTWDFPWLSGDPALSCQWAKEAKWSRKIVAKVNACLASGQR